MEGLLSAALRRLSMLSRTAARTSAENARTSESEPPCRLLKRSSALASATLAAGDPASKQRHASEGAEWAWTQDKGDICLACCGES